MILSDVDIHEPSQYATAIPHDSYSFLRKEAPIFFQREPDGPGYWAIMKHEDVLAISRNPRVFSSLRGGINIPEAGEAALANNSMLLITMDPPQHVQYRKLVSKGFTPRMTQRLEGKIEEAVTTILDKIVDQSEVDFVDAIAAQVPLCLIADLIGWPDDDRQLMFDWTNRVTQVDMDPEDARTAAAEFWVYCSSLIDRVKQEDDDSKEDLLHLLLEAEVDGEKLETMEIVNFLLLLAIGGNETTRNCIAGGFLALHDNPEQLALLREDPEGLLESAVEEMLRWTAPINCFRRTATEDTEIRGQRIREGEKVVMYYASANRDEDVFENPQEFDIRRKKNPHLSFGTGQHSCMGATLARMEIRAVFQQLLARFPDMKPIGPVERSPCNYMNTTVGFSVITGG